MTALRRRMLAFGLLSIASFSLYLATIQSDDYYGLQLERYTPDIFFNAPPVSIVFLGRFGPEAQYNEDLAGCPPVLGCPGQTASYAVVLNGDGTPRPTVCINEVPLIFNVSDSSIEFLKSAYSFDSTLFVTSTVAAFDIESSEESCLEFVRHTERSLKFINYIFVVTHPRAMRALCPSGVEVLRNAGVPDFSLVELTGNPFVLIGKKDSLVSDPLSHSIVYSNPFSHMESSSHHHMPSVVKGNLSEEMTVHSFGCLSSPTKPYHKPAKSKRPAPKECFPKDICAIDEFPVHAAVVSKTVLGSSVHLCAARADAFNGLKAVTKRSGLHLAAVSPVSKKILHRIHHDSTSIVDSSPVDMFLHWAAGENLTVIGVAMGLATKHLSMRTRNLFQEFGIRVIESIDLVGSGSSACFVGRYGLHFSRHQSFGYQKTVTCSECIPVVLKDGQGVDAEIMSAYYSTMEGKSENSFLGGYHKSVALHGREREAFCEKNNAFSQLCLGDNKRSSIRFVPWAIQLKQSTPTEYTVSGRKKPFPRKALGKDSTVKASTFNDGIRSVPVLYLASFNKEAVAKTLASLSSQRFGFYPEVYVAYPSFFGKEYANLVTLFFGEAASMPIEVHDTYATFLAEALEKVWHLAETRAGRDGVKVNHDYIVVIDEDVVPSDSLLAYFDAVLQNGRSLSIDVLGAVNENSLSFTKLIDDGVRTSTTAQGVRYVSHFPTSAFLLSRRFYEAKMLHKIEQCCSQRSWQGWFPNGISSGSVPIQPALPSTYLFVIPELSHAIYYDENSYLRHQSLSAPSSFSRPLMAADETSQSESRPVIRVPPTTIYLQSLQEKLRASRRLLASEFIEGVCEKDTNQTRGVVHPQSTPLADKLWFSLGLNSQLVGAAKDTLVIYPQTSVSDYRGLASIYDCLGLQRGGVSFGLFGSYEGILRVPFGDRTLFVAGNLSPLLRVLG